LIRVVSVEEVRQIEATADASGISYSAMMERAGTAVARRVMQIAANIHEQASITVLVGPGNNGGDGLVAARVIKERSDAQVRCYLLRPRDENDDPVYKAAVESGLFIANAEDDQRYRVLQNMVASSHILVDALFGIGIELPLRAETTKILRSIHQALDAAPIDESDGHIINPTSPQPTNPATRPFIIAVDCPSGLECDTGAIDDHALPANETMTFIAAKPGLFTFPGAESVGTLQIADCGLPADMDGLKDAKRMVADADTVRTLLPKRPASGHKGTFGKALIVGGSINYTGATGLAAEAAYRSGAGLVTVGAPAPVINALAAQSLESTWLMLPSDMGVVAESAHELIRKEAGGYQALLIGPGFGREKTTGEMLARLLENPADGQRSASRGFGFTTSPAQSSRADGEPEPATLPPLVIDADGLFLLHKLDEWWKLLPAETILTPHPGEMATLAGIETSDVQANRWELAAEKAAEWDVVLVLKGAHTLIAEPGGQVIVLPFKTSALATAGTGDVLAGTIAGLLAQGMKPFDAAVAGGYIHGLAGQLIGELSSVRSALAGDIARYGLPQALLALETN
jgi:NAD(P)H-hydrate epimerase